MCDRARHTCIGEGMRRSHQQGPRKLTRSTTRRTCVDRLHCGIGLSFVLVILGVLVWLVLSVVLALLVLLVLCVWLVWSVVANLLMRASRVPLTKPARRRIPGTPRNRTRATRGRIAVDRFQCVLGLAIMLVILVILVSSVLSVVLVVHISQTLHFMWFGAPPLP